MKRRRKVEYFADSEPLGKRLVKFVLYVLAIFGVTAAIVISQRLSDESLSNLAFAIFGAAVCGLPTLLVVAALGGFIYWRERRTRQRASTPPQQPTMMVMPVPMIQPQLPPTYHRQVPQEDWFPQRRNWHAVGGEFEDE